MRWQIVRTLLWKELFRLAGNRGALATIGLLLASGLLLAILGLDGPSLDGSVSLNTFWVDYWEDSPWVEHLRASVPAGLCERIRFRRSADIPADRRGTLQYGRGEGAVQIRPLSNEAHGPRAKVWFWFAGNDPGGLKPFEEWFWRETQYFFHRQAVAALSAGQRPVAEALSPPALTGNVAQLEQELHRLQRERLIALAPESVRGVVPELEVERSALRGLAPRQAAVVALVLFSMYFTCVLFLPSMTCEERERGTLLAQALSPASAAEALAAKAAVYPGLGMVLAASLSALLHPEVSSVAFFWLTLLTAAPGAFGLGIVVASLARTQRSASTGTLCYALNVAILTVVGQRLGIPDVFLPIVEAHLPQLLYTALDNAVLPANWTQLGRTMLLAAIWCGGGTFLFRRYAWR
jgi:hypothetical protein